MNEEEYFEEERLELPGPFSSWKRLLVQHLNDCYRQRRVFREALNELRSEVLTETERRHQENKAQLEEIKEVVDERAKSAQRFQIKIMTVAIITLASLLAYFATNFGPLAAHLERALK